MKRQNRNAFRILCAHYKYAIVWFFLSQAENESSARLNCYIIGVTSFEESDEAGSDLRVNVCANANARLLVAVTESVLSAYTRGSASTMGEITGTLPCALRRARRWRARAHMIGICRKKKSIQVDFHFYGREPPLLSRGTLPPSSRTGQSTAFAGMVYISFLSERIF